MGAANYAVRRFLSFSSEETGGWPELLLCVVCFPTPLVCRRYRRQRYAALVKIA